MLAALRDQENVVHSRQVPSKQQPKTPGARYPKTPGKFGQDNENAVTVFTKKDGAAGRIGGKDNILNTKGNAHHGALVTPLDGRSRAPLGNKTTNAKARTGQANGVKNMVNEIEKTQVKPTTSRKTKQKAPVLFEVKNDEAEPLDDEDLEPEYAPPRPTDLPFESDLLPKGGLSLNGLKKENLYRGFYEQFCNPLDDEGVSKQTRQLENELKAVMDKAIERNEKDLNALDWNEADLSRSPKKLSRVPASQEVAESQMRRKVRGRLNTEQPATIVSRKAAVALCQPSKTKQPALVTKSTSRPKRLEGWMPKRQATNSTAGAMMAMKGSTGIGTLASRTTLGYSKGKSASSMVPPGSSNLQPSHVQRSKTPVSSEEADLTITPMRARQAGFGLLSSKKQTPQFMSIFDAQDDEELPPVQMPNFDDEDDEFELKLDI